MSLRIWKAKTELHKLKFGVKLLNLWKPKFLILKKSCENVKYQQNVNTKLAVMNKLHVRINWSWRFLQIPITTFFFRNCSPMKLHRGKMGNLPTDFVNWKITLQAVCSYRAGSFQKRKYFANKINYFKEF